MSTYRPTITQQDEPAHGDPGPRGGVAPGPRRGARSTNVPSREFWRALVEGRWSVVDRYDADGRRYYVAWRNPGSATRELALTELEEQILMRVAAGEPNKVIAYELGIAYSTVAAYASRACRKLGFAGRMELIQLTRALDLDFSSAIEREPAALAG